MIIREKFLSYDVTAVESFAFFRYVLLDGVSLGDANGDGYVNINDVTAVQRHLSELEALQGIYLLAADVNQNGTQEIDDATLLQAYLAEYDISDPIGEVITQ